MEKIWILPICLGIIGYFGIFWTLNLADIEIDIDLSMDDNTRIAVEHMSDAINTTQTKTDETQPYNYMNYTRPGCYWDKCNRVCCDNRSGICYTTLAYCGDYNLSTWK